MPLYEFRCESCGRFDAAAGFEASTTPQACPACSSASPRVFTAPGVRGNGPLGSDASPTDRSRYDRARTGQPTMTYR